MSFFGRSKDYIGIDLGTSSIKLVQLKEENGKPVLKNYAVLSLPRASATQTLIASAQSTNLISQYKKYIGVLLGQLGISSKKVFFSLPVYPSFSTAVEMPVMSHRELEQAIPLEARKYIPVPTSEVVVDWNIIDQIKKDGVDKYRVLIVAIPQTLVQEYLGIAASNKLTVESMELETFSAARAVVDKNSLVPTLIIDIGANSTDVSVSYRGQIELSHNFEISGINFTNAIAQSLGVDLARAEELKVATGLLGGGGERELSSIIFPMIDGIIGEVVRTASIYEQTFGRSVGKIILVGGSANMKGLLDYMVKKIGIEVSIGNPFMHIQHSPVLEEKLRDLGSELAVACGLALKGFKDFPDSA